MRLRAVTLFALLGAATASAADPVIEKIEAKLFLADSGTLSGDVASGSGVALWNMTIGGEGERADDVLIVVTVKADAGEFIKVPFEIEIKGADGKVVASRKTENILIGASGLMSQGVYLQDATCTALKVTATVGKSTKATEVPFACGE
ncbi:hypothetical protein sos41_29650 [Alphaproteobacteria bacterium SO-S41]|nr:hypothetical protein sos41_29650 [Alphaproteobacteria bacterium SO-S41]